MKTITIRKPLLYFTVILLSLPLCVSAQDNYGEILKAKNGNIGIGTDDPKAKLDIPGGADHDGGNDPKAMSFQYRLGGYRHWIRTRHNGNPANSATRNAIDFFLNSSSTAAGSTAPGYGSVLGMSVTAAGVGIGTETPASSLHISKSGTGSTVERGAELYQPAMAVDNALAFQIGRENDVFNTGKLRFIYKGNGSVNNVLSLGFHTNDDILNVAATGNVGIGTTVPTAKLEIKDPNVMVKIRNTYDNGGIQILNSYNASYFGMYNESASAWGVVPANDSKNFFAIRNDGKVGSVTNIGGTPASFRNVLDDGTGNMGIGTSMPTAKLEIKAPDVMVKIRNTNDNGGIQILNSFNASYFGMYNESDSAWGAVPANDSKNFFAIRNDGKVGSVSNSGGTPAAFRNLLDDGTGNMGIGTTVPTAKLEVKDPNVMVKIRNTNDNGGIQILNSFNASYFGMYNESASAWGAVPANDSKNFFAIRNDGKVGSVTNSGATLPVFRNILDDGRGNMGIGTATPTSPLHIYKSGTGSTVERGAELYQPAMAVNNALAFQIGRSNNNFNAGKLRFIYKGNGSVNNVLSLGFHTNDDILNVAATGKVGIGTIEPGEKLDINGNIKIRGTSADAPAAGKVLTCVDANGTARWRTFSEPTLSKLTVVSPAEGILADIGFVSNAVIPSLRIKGYLSPGTNWKSDITFALSGAANNGTIYDYDYLKFSHSTHTIIAFKPLLIKAPDAMVKIRNTNDNGGIQILNSHNASYFGMYNESGSVWGVVPANDSKNFFAIRNDGKVGSVTNIGGTPASFRNVLDDGTGNMGIGTAEPEEKLDINGNIKIRGVAGESAVNRPVIGRVLTCMDDKGTAKWLDQTSSNGGWVARGTRKRRATESFSSDDETVITDRWVGIGVETMELVTSPLHIVTKEPGNSNFLGQQIYQSTMGINDGLALHIGRENDQYNTGKLRFIYKGDKSTANLFSMGFTGNSNILNVTAGGKVGISTQTPLAKLDILGGSNSIGENGTPMMAFQLFTGGFRHWIKTRHIGVADNYKNAIDFYLNNSVSGEASTAPGAGSVHSMSVTAVGVGISTKAPLAKIDILGGSDYDGTNGASMMAFQYHDGGYRHWIKTRHNGVANDNKNAIDFYLNNSTTRDASSAPDPNSGSVHGMSITATGVGIGTNAPGAKLHVEGGNIKVNNGDLRVRQNGSNGAEVAIGAGLARPGYPGGGWIGTVNNYGLYFGTNNVASNMYLDTDDNVFIGFDYGGIPDVEKAKSKFDLFVHQGILTEDYALAPQSSWSDYVFDKEYQLKKLSEVEIFIQKNKHLPNIPSKEEIAKEGYSLHEVNVKLLEKIEELTLYAIEQEKEIKALKNQVNNYSQQEERIKALEEKILNRAK